MSRHCHLDTLCIFGVLHALHCQLHLPLPASNQIVEIRSSLEMLANSQQDEKDV